MKGKSILRRLAWLALALAGLYGLLRIPAADPPPVAELEGADGTPFVWGEDDLWAQLQALGVQARAGGCAARRPPSDPTEPRLEPEQAEGDPAPDDQEPAAPTPSDPVADLGPPTVASVRARLDELAARPVEPGDPRWLTLENAFFRLAAVEAACPDDVPGLVALQARLRQVVKRHSVRWGVDSREARDRVYRLLYGSRAALEEVLLQLPEDQMPVLSRGVDEPSPAPSTEVRGIRVHSGDILVSRGGAPTSAMIARGSDYPGNFSHVALVHVDDQGEFQTIEAHIERGVVIAPLATYLADTKLRVMLLRLREDLSEDDDGSVAARAADAAVQDATARHIPYDFAMNFDDPEEQFCSEVASANYRVAGVELWQGLTKMSTPGLARWLSAFGVRRFTTHGPSDLEYDPQLVVVAEWRNPEALAQDHLDAAVLDARLEAASRGADVGYDRGMLPVARLLKAYSIVQNVFGIEGRIPEGMSATTGLRVQWLDAPHAAIRGRLERAIATFRAERGYWPPYPELVRLARVAAGPD